MLAVATTLPARSAARTGRRLTTPPVADDDEVDVVARRERLERVGAADALRARRQVQARPASSARRPPPAGAAACSSSSAAFDPAASATTRNALGMRREDVDRLAPDRAGRAEERDAAARPAAVSARRATTYRVTTGAANRNESTRSSMPPWPGMSVPESLAPAARLSIDSARSPACAASADQRPEDEGVDRRSGRAPRA